MSLIIEHLEYLMQRHDCVTLPGIGALIARYVPAHFVSEADVTCLLPPSRAIAFNGQLEDSDGLLERSVSRRCGISFEAARRIVDEEAQALKSQLIEFGELSLGSIGFLAVNQDSKVVFVPSDKRTWDLQFYGLKPLKLRSLEAAESPISQVPNVLPAVSPYDEDADMQKGNHTLVKKIIGVAASIAVLLTLLLSFFNPIQVSNEPEKASLAPVEKETVVENKDEVVDQTITLTDRQFDANLEVVAETEEPLVSNGINASNSATEIEAVKPTVKDRIKDSDRFCIVVASFPDLEQANRYLAENPSRKLGVLNKDGKFRVYSATASTRADAERLRSQCGQQDAWICTR